MYQYLLFVKKNSCSMTFAFKSIKKLKFVWKVIYINVMRDISANFGDFIWYLALKFPNSWQFPDGGHPAFIHTQTCIHVHTHTHTPTYTMYIHKYIYKYMHTNIHAHKYTYTCENQSSLSRLQTGAIGNLHNLLLFGEISWPWVIYIHF